VEDEVTVTTFDSMIGLTMETVESSHDSLVFKSASGKTFEFCHHQDCCESVYIESIDGDLSDLVGAPIVRAEKVSNDGSDPERQDHDGDGVTQWTFYKFESSKGSVTVRWCGISNGYYSTSVTFGESQ
jgi:hypothetical protein